jgi:hypothetical protein
VMYELKVTDRFVRIAALHLMRQQFLRKLRGVRPLQTPRTCRMERAVDHLKSDHGEDLRRGG